MIQLEFQPEVKAALESGKAVVALESNVITHGLDYPENVTTALNVEAAVRESGAVPATIGIDNGVVLVGMNREQIERFASSSNIPKVTSRDLPFILASKKMGATTVASSLVIAELAGIPFFSSAGIGGVHRGAETSMDISSDLIQFTRSKVAVVCAGAKNILDIGLTLEYLETHCVPVVSYKSDDFPAFYCQSSGHKSPMRMDHADEIAEAIEINRGIPNSAGILITTPTRKEDAINSEDIQTAVQLSVDKAEAEGVTGNAVTKFIMKAIEKATSGRSAEANKAVLINTARIAGRLAVAHSNYLK
ncbi:pseudouridine-5'-phosphate glycosidase [Vibrio sagamiensis]|uniref:Pseudouridine-5'-phosphate glycosidase n=1 Tax=Vibrio sagamiensis NBRC 104589 TaxID=1219064 RepID=A0A511QLS5_9VIBR|nr:pseudouridine-5'-phosphate glycosidase [Vibrio sagamiensis]PNQ56747.1 pseudouridine-5'-phosphate glycosidase [Vibrio agarivorans]GEM77472.1 pseudouridine-5'-phosphate glycosidase [Vibrio sagamiensis NBRC 104589]